MIKTRALIFLVLLQSTACAFTDSISNKNIVNIPEKFDRFDAYIRVAFAKPDTGKYVLNAFDTDFSELYTDEKLDKWDNNQLAILFRAAYLTNFYADNARLNLQEKAFHTLENRNYRFDNATLADMFGTYIAARNWDSARQLRTKYYSEIGRSTFEVPMIIDNIKPTEANPTAWVVDINDNQITRKAYNINVGLQIIAVVNPLCHFSANAIDSIKKDPQLMTAFSNNTIWLAPVDERLRLDIFQAWHKENPGFQQVIAHKQSQWPMIHDWATPDFYFLRDGKLIARVNGWPPEGRRDELFEAVRLLESPK